MSNGWIVRNATPDDILRFLISNPRFYIAAAKEFNQNKRSIMVDVGDETYEVGNFSFEKEQWTFGAECGGPAPWRGLKLTTCPFDPRFELDDDKCPICGGQQDQHFNVGAHHPIFRFLKG